MFTPARYIAIDDDPDELVPLVDALHAIGAPCIGIRFDPPALPEPALFAGFRILLTDLHLLRAAAGAAQHYDTVAGLLMRCVPDHHGPYLLILWTSHDEERAALSERLAEVLPPEKMPLAVLALEKERFRADGGWNGPALQQALRERIAAMPQLGALLSWERDVLAAANATLALVGSLVPSAQRGFDAYSGGLDRVLSLLATAAAGETNARADPRGAVSAALAPLLADRVLNQGEIHGAAELWHQAVTFPQGAPALTENQKASMHRMLHFAVPPAEPVAKTDWGAIIPLGPEQLEHAAVMARFGVTEAHLREREFKLKADRRDAGHLVIIRAGAACDQAQENCGPIPILLGLLVPDSALGRDKLSAAIHRCPERLLLEEDAGPMSLLVHARFGAALVADDLQRWPAPILRIREQLLMTILVHAATHVMRPGTLRF